jgi:hypothetical protein
MPQRDWDEVLSKLAARSAEIGHERDEQARHTLSEDHVRVLGYFWNRDKQAPRRGLPMSVIFFFEIDRHPPGAEAEREAQAFKLLQQLLVKDYLAAGESQLVLTADGMAWMLHQHPPTVRWWQKQLEKVPPKAQMVVTTLGLTASVLAIVQALRYAWP